MINKYSLLRLLPMVSFIFFWEMICRINNELVFFFGLPTKIIYYLFSKTINGTLVIDFSLTLFETIAGFILGNLIGTTIGLGLWFSKTIFNMAKPYIIALGSAPIFALAPLMILWFGTGIFSKVMMATLSTVFIALFQAYSGALAVNKDYIKLLQSFNATKRQVFTKIIVPSSIVWVISAFKINVGFALLGAFIGEYISSNAGLGHLILVASGLFNISLVLTGVLLMIIIALLFNVIITKIELPLKKLIINHL